MEQAFQPELTDQERAEIEAKIRKDGATALAVYHELKNALRTSNIGVMSKKLDARELRLVRNCLVYRDEDPAGLPGHNLMIIIGKLIDMLNLDEKDLTALIDQQ